MRRKNLQARVSRALSGKTQEQTAEEVGVTPPLIAQIERGKVEPSDGTLAGIAGTADLTVPDLEEIVRLAETLRRSPRWKGPDAEAVLGELTERLRVQLAQAIQRLSTLRFPAVEPGAEARRQAAELRERLESLSAAPRAMAGQEAERSPWRLLYEAAREQAVREAPRDPASAAAWEQVAREIGVASPSES
ncbi:MAG TPA: helix-turn-helix transcriptional regulator [Thermoanaerobaculia bacterium]|jgi:transcriptional regulator with XRE-family HTH domain|nr:helix-turn-helix transcriptional regulator [Thermoanaerobaculia bacterium]